MSTLKDINKDLDEITINVEKVHTKFSPMKSKYTFKEREYKPPAPSYPRNYHPPLHEEERRRSYSPKKYNNYDSGDNYD